jgi:hypothetical protein
MTTVQRDAIIDPVDGLQIFNTTTNCLEFYVNSLWQTIGCGCTAGPATPPIAAAAIASGSQIKWNWNEVPDASGYKYNTVNNYATATDNQTSTTYTETGLTCTNMAQLLYVWAYNACGNSSPTTLSASLVFPLIITKAGNGTGTVSRSVVCINCGENCCEEYYCGTEVTLTAAADPGSTFTGWSGACAGTGSCIITMHSPQSVTATFTRDAFPLTVTKTGTGSGLITSSPLAIYCGATCGAILDEGTLVTLTATPDAGSTFTGWTGACSGTGSCIVTMDNAKSVGASFAIEEFPLTITRVGPGTVTSSPAGIFCGASCSANYNSGTLVTITATPDAGASFAGWSGACSGTASSCTVAMDMARNVTATFTYPLTVSKTGSGSGTVTSSPLAIACGSTCTANFDYNAVVTLTATADAGSTFTGWSGACSGMGSCAITMNAPRSVSATFTHTTFPLTITKTGSGSGTVTSSPLAIYCGATCTATFDEGTLVTITATPTAGSVFTGWSGACTGSATTCIVAMNAAKNVTATFAHQEFPLTISKVGPGTVTSAPAGIYCGAACIASYNTGTLVTITATPDPGATFVGWSGACTGAANTCIVTMDMAKSVTATFTPNNYSLTILKPGNGSGTVTSSPAGISCGSTCSANFTGGTTVTLTAAASLGSSFTGWSGACSGVGTCITTMNNSQTVTANFTLNTYPLTVTLAGNGLGKVTSSPAGINCGIFCSSSYPYGTVVTLTALPEVGYSFMGWSGGGFTGTGTCVCTMTSAQNVVATFSP